MRWLYRILRLFFCPHRWDMVKNAPYTYRKCRMCGKGRSFH